MNSDDDRRWLREHGIDGEYGLEIEAVGDLETAGADLRRLVVEEIRDDIRERERYKQGVEELIGLVVQDTVDEILDSITDDLRSALRDAGYAAIEERPYVEDLTWNDTGHFARVDFESHREDPDYHLPEPPSEGEIHERAIEGEELTYQTGAAKARLQSALMDQIREGEIDVADLLDQ